VPETAVLPEITSVAMPQAGSADCSACVRVDSGIVPTDAAMATFAEAKVGHHKDADSEKSCCFRPGCYVLFAVTTRSPQQCFCSSACRNALRRVRQRETHWFHRLEMSFRHRGPPADDID
jgi:hypothetical protein